MPISKTFYLCNVCHKQYDNFDDAITCENKKLPTGDLQIKLLNTKIGDFLEFEEEEKLGSYWSYSNQIGEVLTKYITYSTTRNSHVCVVLVKVKRHNITYERGVIEGVNEFEFESLISPAELIYESGYSNLVKSSDIAYEI
jgi:hypothetical protein